MRIYHYVLLSFLLTLMSNQSLDAKSKTAGSPVKVLIVDGFSNHDWVQPTSLTRGIPEQTKRFQVDVVTCYFSSPFNGKDLTNWGYRNKKQEEIVFESFDGRNNSEDGRFTGKDGILAVNPWNQEKGPHLVSLWTKQEYPGDFSLTIEFRASVNADSGIFIRGKQLQCRDYLVAGPYKELRNYKAQDWNKIEVTVKNNVARCTCNGELLEEALVLPITGSLGIEADRGLMEYRNIQIKKL